MSVDNDNVSVVATTEGAAAEITGPAPFGARFTVPLYLGAVLNPVNSSLIATALVPIAAFLRVDVGATAVLISSLYLTCAVAQPAAGRLAEEFGARRVFLAGILLVLAAGVVGCLARGVPALVVARVLVGAGTSAGYPAAMLLIRRRAHDAGLSSPPGAVLGGIAIASAATISIGPAAGGLLVGSLGWRAAFWVNLPVAAAALALALWGIPRDAPVRRGSSIRQTAARIDPEGMALFAAALIALLVFLNALPAPHWDALAAAAGFTAGLIAWELRAANPFLDVRLLAANLALTRTYLRNGLTLLGTYVIMYGLTQWLEAARGMSAYQAGLVLIPMGALSAAGARVASRRPRVRAQLVFSALVLLVGALASLLLTGSSPVIAVVGVTALFGLTSGASTVANQTVVYQEAPAERLGVASGLLRTFGYLGSIASAAITGIAFHARVDDAGLHHISWALTAVAAAVTLMTLFDRGLARADARLQARTAADDHAVSRPIRETRKTVTEKKEDARMTANAPALDPTRTALLMMDFQPAVLAAVPDGEQALDRARAALSWARSHDVQVAHVRVAFQPDDHAAVPAGNKAFARIAAGALLADGSPETALHESIDVHPTDILVRKTRIGAFASATDLRALLRERGVDTLVLAGLSTGGVVLTTLRQAADDDFRLFVLKDATGDPDPEVHRVLTEKVFPGQAEVIAADDLHTLIQNG